MLTRKDPAMPVSIQDIKRRTILVEERPRFLRDMVPDMLVAPGLAWIKIVDLFKKWRKYVPPHLQDIICPEPTAQMLEVIAEQRRKKNRRRRQTA
jgi:hypothetical protein